MTAKSSAEFWLEHASEFSNHTQHAISATDEKILKADASAAGKGLVTTLVTTQSITHAVTVAYFAGCVGSIHKGIVIGFGLEGSWWDVISGWFF